MRSSDPSSVGEVIGDLVSLPEEDIHGLPMDVVPLLHVVGEDRLRILPPALICCSVLRSPGQTVARVRRKVRGVMSRGTPCRRRTPS